MKKPPHKIRYTHTGNIQQDDLFVTLEFAGWNPDICLSAGLWFYKNAYTDVCPSKEQTYAVKAQVDEIISQVNIWQSSEEAPGHASSPRGWPGTVNKSQNLKFSAGIWNIT